MSRTRTPAACAVLLIASACGEAQCLLPCRYSGVAETNVRVVLSPPTESAYEAIVDSDEASFAFTCPDEGLVTGLGPVSECYADGFTFLGSPTSVEATVDAVDGTWNGTASEELVYEIPVVCGSRCSPSATVNVQRDE